MSTCGTLAGRPPGTAHAPPSSPPAQTKSGFHGSHRRYHPRCTQQLHEDETQHAVEFVTQCAQVKARLEACLNLQGERFVWCNRFQIADSGLALDKAAGCDDVIVVWEALEARVLSAHCESC